MKNILFVLCIAVCMTTGCTWREGFVSTCGFVAGGLAGAAGLPVMETADIVEGSVDLAIEGGVAAKDAHDTSVAKRENEEMEERMSGN